MRTALLSVLACVLSACGGVTPSGGMAIGGNGMMMGKKPDGSMYVWIYKQEGSFQHFMQAIGAALTTKYAFKTQESNNGVNAIKEKAKGEALVKGTKDPNVIPLNPNVIPVNPNIIPK